MKNNASLNVISKRDRESGFATRVFFEGGHGIQLDDPEGVSEAIQKWWGTIRK